MLARKYNKTLNNFYIKSFALHSGKANLNFGVSFIDFGSLFQNITFMTVFKYRKF